MLGWITITPGEVLKLKPPTPKPAASSSARGSSKAARTLGEKPSFGQMRKKKQLKHSSYTTHPCNGLLACWNPEITEFVHNLPYKLSNITFVLTNLSNPFQPRNRQWPGAPVPWTTQHAPGDLMRNTQSLNFTKKTVQVKSQPLRYTVIV